MWDIIKWHDCAINLCNTNVSIKNTEIIYIKMQFFRPGVFYIIAVISIISSIGSSSSSSSSSTGSCSCCSSCSCCCDSMYRQNIDGAGKKREACMIEMQKLREGRSTPEQSAVQGRLTISDIKLPLKSEFMSKIGSVHGKLVSCSRLTP